MSSMETLARISARMDWDQARMLLVACQWIDDDETELEFDDYVSAIAEEESLEPEDGEEGPMDGDIWTTDYRTFHLYQWISRKPVVTVPEPKTGRFRDDFWVKPVTQYMDAIKFWPNVWFRGERGDWNLLDRSTGKFASK